MREDHKIQLTLAMPWLDAPHAKEPETVSDLLDNHFTIGECLAQDIGLAGGRPGITGDHDRCH